ncbi:putative 37S ribosomal protein S4-like [Zancudomyces culisetae]|uniref:Putative 37S ribosomal protein S4-like n=1 Tax=Zancudomyces culisetae TaxID=1213189 RepID=A0A1R1PUJ5_ZANCU|nr:putative 37S ribosomal protein S4-like [Zancudomyces culisetae]|eukprot:OMH84607.1 putative 37S ribosomal protein S4-like [Zancudomyces culisetae]
MPIGSRLQKQYKNPLKPANKRKRDENHAVIVRKRDADNIGLTEGKRVDSHSHSHKSEPGSSKRLKGQSANARKKGEKEKKSETQEYVHPKTGIQVRGKHRARRGGGVDRRGGKGRSKGGVGGGGDGARDRVGIRVSDDINGVDRELKIEHTLDTHGEKRDIKEVSEKSKKLEGTGYDLRNKEKSLGEQKGVSDANEKQDSAKNINEHVDVEGGGEHHQLEKAGQIIRNTGGLEKEEGKKRDKEWDYAMHLQFIEKVLERLAELKSTSKKCHQTDSHSGNQRLRFGYAESVNYFFESGDTSLSRILNDSNVYKYYTEQAKKRVHRLLALKNVKAAKSKYHIEKFLCDTSECLLEKLLNMKVGLESELLMKNPPSKPVEEKLDGSQLAATPESHFGGDKQSVGTLQKASSRPAAQQKRGTPTSQLSVHNSQDEPTIPQPTGFYSQDEVGSDIECSTESDEHAGKPPRLQGETKPEAYPGVEVLMEIATETHINDVERSEASKLRIQTILSTIRTYHGINPLRKGWTKEEILCLDGCVEMYMRPAYALFLNLHGESGVCSHVLKDRTSVNLKDKVRNNIRALEKAGVELGPYRYFFHITEKTWLKVFNENLPAISTKLTRQKQNSRNQQHISPTSLLYADLERRVDFIVFRSHFASSVWNARRMVLQGHVKLNGKVFRKPGHRVSDGDVITVDPYVIPTLVDPVNSKSTENSKQDQPQESTESQDTPTTLSENETKSQAESGTESVILNTLKKTRGEHYAFKPFPYQQPFMFLPEYLEVNYNICSTMFLRSPTLKPNGSNCDLPSPFPPDLHSLAYLYYLKRGRRSSRV